MTTIINRADLTFLLRDWLGIEDLFERPRFAAHAFDTVEAMLDVAERLATDLLAPSLRSGDTNEPFLDDAQNVQIDAKVREAVNGLVESGLFGAVFAEDQGGLQLPFLVYVAAMGILHSASSAATFYMMLTVGNARLLANFAEKPLFDAFGAPQVTGEAFGTMCLSEPQAGSSLGDIATRALFEGTDDLGERYRINGSKMWISGADHDVSGNIVHLVLAKVPNDDGTLPTGSRGISLFVVPKLLPDGERNDVVVAGLNHKLGSRALPNAAFNLGEGFTRPGDKAGAIGWRIGREGQGLQLMFQMMNEARTSVGVAGAMIAYRGYLLSLAYARERAQGRPIGTGGGTQVPIIEHVDVRRMLLAQKAICEGAFALTLLSARLQDDEATASTPEARDEASELVGLLTPIVKTWPSEFGQVSLNHAIQILGGSGYTRDFEVELLYRDNRINPIHEGTTGIQGLDLVNRKLRKDGGAAYTALRKRVVAALDAAAGQPDVSDLAATLTTAWAEIDAAVAHLVAMDTDTAAAAHATALLTAMGHGVIGWIWLEIATLAAEQLATQMHEATRNYLYGKIKGGCYFAEVELPQIAAWLAPLRNDAQAAATIKIEEFLGEVA
jgi:alkylation response protein AidB-like acyl-CoA dehydrogenase